MWVILALLSAVLLGIYEVFKKLSVHKNAVIPVLFLSTLTSAIIFLPLTVGSVLYPEFFKSIHLFIPDIKLEEHGLILIKSVIVVSSWILAFFAVKIFRLPLLLLSMQPTRSGPCWVLWSFLVNT